MAQVRVPVDAAEKEWRKWIRAKAAGTPLVSPSAASSVRRRVRSAVAAGGAELVRLKVWRTHSPPPVEMVVATAKPAPYLRHRLANAAGAAGHGYLFLEVVDSWGSRILEHTTRATEGTLYVKPRLLGCEPFPLIGFLTRVPACPAS